MKNKDKANLSFALGRVAAVSSRLSEYAAHDPCRITPWMVLPRNVWNELRHQLLNPKERPKPPREFIDAVMALCKFENDHWIWPRLSKNQPQMTWKGKTYKVRRELMREHGIEGDMDDRNCMVLTTCGHPQCVNPHHLQTMSAFDYVNRNKTETGRKISQGLSRFHEERRRAVTQV